MRTYGKVFYAQGKWVVDCETHVRMRAKRIFGKVAQGDQVIMVSDTIENCREIAWFMERFPLEISADDSARLCDGARRHRQLAESVGAILDGTYVPRAIQLALPPRQYQRQAAELCLTTTGLIVADDVGLGKTVTGICVLADPQLRPALVVTLTHLPRQWDAELKRFLPGIRTHILKKGTPYKLTACARDLFNPSDLPDVIICNYHKLAGWADELAGHVRTVIFDECHELRNNDSYKYGAAKQIADAAAMRMGLTATPVFNTGSEIFNIANVIRDGALGDRSEFSREWVGYNEHVKDPQALGSHLREVGLMLRRTRADAGRELPGLTVIPHMIEADTKAIDSIKSSAAELARIILAAGGSGFDKLKASEELSWKLRQATGIAKAPYVADFVRLLLESEAKVVLFGWHREVYSLWADRLADLKPVFFTGSESPNQKDEARKAFCEGDSRVLIMSLRAGQGLDGLQHICRTVVYGELDWSPAVHEQATGRVYRDGQKDPVMAYFLTADCGSDPVVADVLGVKAMQADGIRDPSGVDLDKGQIDPQRIAKLAKDYLQQIGGLAA